jgi:hypothetical protein
LQPQEAVPSEATSSLARDRTSAIASKLASYNSLNPAEACGALVGRVIPNPPKERRVTENAPYPKKPVMDLRHKPPWVIPALRGIILALSEKSGVFTTTSGYPSCVWTPGIWRPALPNPS